MTSPYRNELDALRERKGSLEQELARLKEERAQLEVLRSREQELERELAAVAQKLGSSTARRALPMLDEVRVASPCNARWDEMLGDDRVRFCTSCAKNVYNLSAMASEDAERLLQERAGSELCVRFYQRADGTILTEDCPVGVKKKRRRKLALAAVGGSAMAFAATLSQAHGIAGERMGAVAVQGEMEPVMGKSAEPTPPPPNPQRWVMGDYAGPEPTPQVTGTEPVPHVMGTVAVPSPPPPVKMKMGRRAP